MRVDFGQMVSHGARAGDTQRPYIERVPVGGDDWVATRWYAVCGTPTIMTSEAARIGSTLASAALALPHASVSRTGASLELEGKSAGACNENCSS